MDSVDNDSHDDNNEVVDCWKVEPCITMAYSHVWMKQNKLF